MWKPAYNHTRACKRAGIKVSGRQKSVFISVQKYEALNDRIRTRLKKLVQLGYNVQTEIE